MAALPAQLSPPEKRTTDSSNVTRFQLEINNAVVIISQHFLGESDDQMSSMISLDDR
jgi:hypothetical protein